jgi:hypothetical protein
MASFDFDWTGPEQTALTSSVDQGAQYRQLGFNFIDMLRDLCGYTVEASSDGGGVNFGAGDFIVDEADIVWGTGDTQDHSYALLRPPAGKGNPSSAPGFGIIVDFTNANVDATPQTVVLVFGFGNTLTNGDANSRPTLQNEESTVTINLVPWTAPVAGSFCRWENTNNDFVFAVKADGELFFRCIIIIASDPDNALGNNTLWMLASAATNDQVTDSNFGSAVGFRNMLADGTAAATNVTLFSSAFGLTSWTNGQEAVTGRVLWRDVEVLSNGSGASARVLGLFRDVLSCPRNTPFNQRDPDDDGAEAPYEWIGIGDILLPSDAEIT